MTLPIFGNLLHFLYPLLDINDCFNVYFSSHKVGVPNLPCGVERDNFLGSLYGSSTFLIYRVELKEKN